MIETNNLDRAFNELKAATKRWVTPPKRDDRIKRRELVKKRSGARWAKGSLVDEQVYAGELLARMHEETDKQLEKQRLPGQNDFKNVEKRTGRGMMSSQFIGMVLKLNSNLVCEDSPLKGCAAFYLIKNNPKTGKREKIYTAACFRKGFIPEWTIIRTDAADMFNSDGLTYGWRTVLQRLVQSKALRYRDAVEIFGEVYHEDLRGKNWALAVAPFRS